MIQIILYNTLLNYRDLIGYLPSLHGRFYYFQSLKMLYYRTHSAHNVSDAILFSKLKKQNASLTLCQ